MADIDRTNPELQTLKLNKESGYNFRKRRQDDWLENYTLSRDKLTINRLTQRQSVNLPLMKTVIKTILKDVDDLPVIYFENLDNDKQAQMFKNEYWKLVGDDNRFELQDIVDKRQIIMFGRSFDQWQIVDGKCQMTIQDPQDILVSRYTDPTNIHSSRFLIHTNIYKSLAEIEKDPLYDKKEVKKLKEWFKSEMGLIKSAENQTMQTEKNKKLAEMGLDDVEDPVLGETIVELSMHFIYREEDDKEEELYMYVEAEDMVILSKKPLEEVLGTTKDNYWRNHFNYNSWADDLERQDFWSDGICDLVRTPNKVLNSWFSQLVENRTLRNFGMHYFDSTIEGFMPSTFQPIPWGWYGVPGKPQDVLQKVDIPDLSESLDEMNYVTEMVEKASGATSTQQGVQTERQITLGEVELALGEAKERIKGMSKFYTQVWKERAKTFLKLIEGSSDKIDAVKIYKEGRNTDEIYSREVNPNDWMTPAGYRVKIWSQDERDAKNSEELQKLNAVKLNMPDNPKLAEIYNRKLLEFVDLPPDDINAVMEFEEQKREMLLSNPMMGMPVEQQGQQPQEPAPAPALAPPPAPKKN